MTGNAITLHSPTIPPYHVHHRRTFPVVTEMDGFPIVDVGSHRIVGRSDSVRCQITGGFWELMPNVKILGAPK